MLDWKDINEEAPVIGRSYCVAVLPPNYKQLLDEGYNFTNWRSNHGFGFYRYVSNGNWLGCNGNVLKKIVTHFAEAPELPKI